MNELVSIIMPNYNCEKFLSETIESVLAQTYQNWELLIVDDCSTDKSIEIINDYCNKDKRIKLFQNKPNKGAAFSRNLALREAKGKWIAFLDSDDLWLPDKLKNQIQFMNDKNYHFSYTLYEKVDETTKPLHKLVTGPKKINKHKMFNYCYIGCLTVMYDAEVVGLIQVDDNLRSRNDYAMWLKVCKKADCYLLNENLAKYRVRKGTLSHSGLKTSIKNQYKMFRRSEKMNCINATWHTMLNLFFGVLKKVVYTKQI